MRVATRGNRIAPAVALVAAAFLAAGAETKTAEAEGRPNIVLIVADDLGWNSVGYHGGPIRTPHIDRIARQGVALDRFYVSPMCSPTRAGLLTGRYPMRFGMARSVVRPWSRYGLPPQERTLAEILAEAGYSHRGIFGKWHLGHLDPKWHPLSRGFTHFEGQYNGAADYWTRERNGEIDWHLNAEPHEERGYTTDLIAGAACGFIRQHAADGPFLCYVPFTAPHTPLQAPQAYLRQYAHLDDDPADGRPSDLQALAAMITCMDDGIGRILASLEETGALGNTLIWFMSDNGGVGSIPGVNHPLREGKLTVYEGGVRVPGAVWWPGMIEGGRTIGEPMLNIDVVPTLMRIVGIRTPGGAKLDGIDVVDVLSGRSTSLAPRDLFMFTGQAGLGKEQIAVISEDGWKLAVTGPDIRRSQGIRKPDHRVELFRLAEDPLETADLADREPDLVDRLSRKLTAFRASESADSLPPMNKAPRGFTPPSRWRNTPMVAPAGPGAATVCRPNILFVLIDDMGYGDLGCFGGTRCETPNTDRLAREGVRFTQFYVNSPVCSPSRVAFTTGQYPDRWRITSYLDTREANQRRGMTDWLSTEAPALARFLARAGYFTAHVGKWHMGGQRDVDDAPSITDYGFANALANFEGLGERVLPRFEPKENGKPFDHLPTRMNAAVGGGPIHWIDRHAVTAFYADRAIREIRTACAQARPFYINLWLDDVHTPLEPPPGGRGAGSRSARYAGVVKEMDRQLGRLFDVIRSDPALRDTTLILLASDNGPENGCGSTGGLRGGKGNLYEGGIRSPLIAWGGPLAKTAAGSENAKTVLAAIDLLPSLLVLGGMELPADAGFDGMNMADAFTGRAMPTREGPLFWSRPPDRPGPENRWPDLAIRDGDWKLLMAADGSRPELYNLADDPGETMNLAGNRPDVTQGLRGQLLEWRRSVGIPRSTPQRSDGGAPSTPLRAGPVGL